MFRTQLLREDIIVTRYALVEYDVMTELGDRLLAWCQCNETAAAVVHYYGISSIIVHSHPQRGWSQSRYCHISTDH